MAGAIEVFEAAVFEAVFETLSVKDGDAACDVIASGLAEVVDGLSHADAVEFVVPNAPRLVPERESLTEEGRAASMVINDFWYREDTFSPIFYALAREFYLRVRPQTYLFAPVAQLAEDDRALFGCKLTDIRFEGEKSPAGGENAAMMLWAGCSVAAVKFCFQRSIAMPIGYALLFDFVRNSAA